MVGKMWDVTYVDTQTPGNVNIELDSVGFTINIKKESKNKKFV